MFDIFLSGLQIECATRGYRVWHDGSGMGSAWYLDKVVVADKQSKRTWEFVFSSWIKGGKPMEKPAVVQYTCFTNLYCKGAEDVIVLRRHS